METILRPTTEFCPKCKGVLYETSSGYVCLSCGHVETS